MQYIWFPSNTPNSKIVGRFDDLIKEYTDKDGVKQTRTKLMLYTEVPGVAEPDARPVLEDDEGKKIKAEWSEAYAAYLKSKATPAAEQIPIATQYGIKGTPIEHADFIGKDMLAMFNMMGFTIIEQIAGMSDAQCQRVGFDSQRLRKQAREFLSVKNDSAKSGPSVADLMAQLSEANAKIAMLIEAVTKPASVADDSRDMRVQDHIERDAPKRRGRPKAAEAKPEA